MHGEGARRVCPTCGQPTPEGLRDSLSVRELRGPREITSSNIDRCFDDAGRRFLFIEEKNNLEQIRDGQRRMLRSLARLPTVDVWGVQGTPNELAIYKINSDGSRVVDRGDWGTYQAAVNDWFDASTPAPEWERALFALVEAPFEPPAWCSSTTWRAFDLYEQRPELGYAEQDAAHACHPNGSLVGYSPRAGMPDDHLVLFTALLRAVVDEWVAAGFTNGVAA